MSEAQRIEEEIRGMCVPDQVRVAEFAARHAALYADAVAAAAERVLGSRDSYGQRSAALILILAVRNVLRAGELARMVVNVSGAYGSVAGFLTALDGFKKALPKVADARNVLDHFDAYHVGVGRSDAFPELARSDFPILKQTCRGWAVCIGDIEVDADVAYNAARTLTAYLGGAATRLGFQHNAGG